MPNVKERVVADQEEGQHLEELRRIVTEEIVVQPGGEEAGRLSQSDVEKMASIPHEVKLEVRRAHHQLGHPAGAVLARLCKLAKKSPDHVWHARKFRRPVCLARQAPPMLSGWIAPFGAPMCIRHDQGPEFHSAFMLMGVGGKLMVMGAGAPVQSLASWVSEWHAGHHLEAEGPDIPSSRPGFIMLNSR